LEMNADDYVICFTVGERRFIPANDSVLAQLIRWFGLQKNVEKVGQAVSLK